MRKERSWDYSCSRGKLEKILREEEGSGWSFVFSRERKIPRHCWTEFCGEDHSFEDTRHHPETGRRKTLSLRKDALKDLSYIRKRIAFVPEFPALLEELTVRENLLFFSRLRGVKMESFIVSEFMLEPFMGTLVRNASKGVKQRTALAAALFGNPELLILDEPTSGLDVESASIVRSKLKRLKEEGITVIISSHIREDIEELCDEILVINGESGGSNLERDR